MCVFLQVTEEIIEMLHRPNKELNSMGMNEFSERYGIIHQEHIENAQIGECWDRMFFETSSAYCDDSAQCRSFLKTILQLITLCKSWPKNSLFLPDSDICLMAVTKILQRKWNEIKCAKTLAGITVVNTSHNKSNPEAQAHFRRFLILLTMEHINQFFDLVESALKEHEGNKVSSNIDLKKISWFIVLCNGIGFGQHCCTQLNAYYCSWAHLIVLHLEWLIWVCELRERSIDVLWICMLTVWKRPFAGSWTAGRGIRKN